MTDLVERLIVYETSDEITDEQVLQLVADLVATGLAWRLQGRYGRMADSLIRASWITPQGEITDAGREACKPFMQGAE
jgi:hypothetical protein